MLDGTCVQERSNMAVQAGIPPPEAAWNLIAFASPHSL